MMYYEDGDIVNKKFEGLFCERRRMPREDPGSIKFGDLEKILLREGWQTAGTADYRFTTCVTFMSANRIAQLQVYYSSIPDTYMVYNRWLYACSMQYISSNNEGEKYVRLNEIEQVLCRKLNLTEFLEKQLSTKGEEDE